LKQKTLESDYELKTNKLPLNTEAIVATPKYKQIKMSKMGDINQLIQRELVSTKNKEVR